MLIPAAGELAAGYFWPRDHWPAEIKVCYAMVHWTTIVEII
jgi:hypothetical protein